MSTDLLAEDVEALARQLSGASSEFAASAAKTHMSQARDLLASDWLAAHDAQVRADERQKVAARLADEKYVEKVAEVLLHDYEMQYAAESVTWRDFAPLARAALAAIAGLIGGEDE